MKYMLKIIGLLMLLAVVSCKDVVTGGGDGNVDPPIDVGPVVTVLSGKLEVREATPQARALTVEVGDIKTTQSLYFIIRNVGETPIFDVELTSNHANVQVSPSSISVLDTDATSSVYTLIRVDITHGSTVGSIGFTDLIAQGDFTSLVTVSGSTETTISTTDGEGVTTEETIIEDISLPIELNGFVKVAQWTVEGNYNLAGWQPMTFDAEYNNGIGAYVQNTWDNATFLNQIGEATSSPDVDSIRIKNTGNVPITIKFDNRVSFTTGGVTLQPNEEVVRDIMSTFVLAGSFSHSTYFTVKTGGVVIPKTSMGDYLNFIEGTDCVVLPFLVEYTINQVNP